jgi:hypothetical protein
MAKVIARLGSCLLASLDSLPSQLIALARLTVTTSVLLRSQSPALLEFFFALTLLGLATSWLPIAVC